MDLGRLVSVVVSPRERFSSIVASLESLFATVPEAVRVVVVEGATPASIRARLASMAASRPFEWVSLERMVIPSVARNLGAARTTTPYVVFADNDIHYEPLWLEALVENAESSGAGAVAPLICIGPPRATTIHHAGGAFEATESDGRIVLGEVHHLSGVPIGEFRGEAAPARTDVCEFHCCLVRRRLLDAMGGFDERLITREQMDFGLRCKALGAKLTFERKSVVTYMAFEPFDARDLTYHVFRWADALVVQSLDAFETTWNMRLDRDYIRFTWIGRHRSRAVATRHPIWRRVIGRRGIDRWLTPRYEASVEADVEAARVRAESFTPSPSPATARALFGLPVADGAA